MKRVVFAVLFLGALPAFAEASIVSGTHNRLYKKNYDKLLDSDASGTITPGDRLRGVLRVDSVTPDGFPIDDDVDPEITGIFDITLYHILPAFGGPLPGGALPSVGHLLFGPTPNGLSGLDTLAGVPVASGTMAVLFQDPANDFDAGIAGALTVGAAEALATGGSLLAAFGMPLAGGIVDPDADGDADAVPAVGTWGVGGNGYWYSDYASPAGAGIPPVPPVGIVPFSLGLERIPGVGSLTALVPIANPEIPHSILGFPPGTAIGANAIVPGAILFPLVGGGDVKGTTDPDIADIYAAESLDPLHLQPIPEPMSMFVWSGLLGVAVFANRARRFFV
jgi:hypothetical protein